MWQNALMPVVLMASIVFAGLSSLGQERGDDFLLNWSAILGAGTTFALPLCWGMPFSRLARHFHKAGCAVAGWCGAEKISRRRAMILTDGDLFPPGTIQLNGVKVFGEDLSRVSSYAASMARAADCGLQRLFDGLLRSEGGHYEKVDDFSFYEEGGYSATIRGESVLLGTASFMRKMEVRLPGGINLRTGIFLAMDRQLAAVFAVKYQPSENVDFALRMMRRSRITPILASRDPNITPALLKRKFHKGVKVEFPSLTDRVAFSEAELDRGMPRALLLMSPWADMTMSGASYRERVESDPMLTPEYIEAVRRAYAGDRDLHDPDLSPLLGDLGSFPPTLIQVGDHEILYSDSASLSAALRAAHVPCRLEVSEGMWHVFQMFPIKKAAAAMESAARFLLEL